MVQGHLHWAMTGFTTGHDPEMPILLSRVNAAPNQDHGEGLEGRRDPWLT